MPDKKLIIREITIFLENSSFHRNPSLYDEDASSIFSEELMAAFETATDGEDYYFDFDPWAENQDPDCKTTSEVTDIYDLEGETATADIVVIQWKQPLKKTVFLKYESDAWHIDDFTVNEDGGTLRQMLSKMQP